MITIIFIMQNKYKVRQGQQPKKTDAGTPGNQTKRLNSINDKCHQASLHNGVHTINLTICENTSQFSASVKSYGPLLSNFLDSRIGKVLIGGFFQFADDEQGITILVLFKLINTTIERILFIS